MNAEVYGYACVHLINDGGLDVYHYYSGRGMEYHLLCKACADDLSTLPETLKSVSEDQFTDIDGYCEGLRGKPEILVRSSKLLFLHTEVKLNQPLLSTILDIKPEHNSHESSWIALLSSFELVRLNFSTGFVTQVCSIPPDQFATSENVGLHISPNSEFAAVVDNKSSLGLVVDLLTGNMVMQLNRGSYHNEQTPFPIAFFQSEKIVLIVHATDWNRLDISNPRTGELLTNRTLKDEPHPEHYLDYFHSGLSISPDNQWIVEDGWVWHPFGATRCWNLQTWLKDNIWESDDGKSVHNFNHRTYHWNTPLCWLSDHLLGIWGLGNDDLCMVDGIQLFDVQTGKVLRKFTGPKQGNLYFDIYLFSISKEGVEVWDVKSGERLLHDAGLVPHHYHRQTKEFLSILPDNRFRLSKLVNS